MPFDNVSVQWKIEKQKGDKEKIVIGATTRILSAATTNIDKENPIDENEVVGKVDILQKEKFKNVEKQKGDKEKIVIGATTRMLRLNLRLFIQYFPVSLASRLHM